MAAFKRGDRVVVIDRSVTAADRKSGLYYNHFRGVHGVVDQVYEEEGEVCVEVDQDTLPPEFARRHAAIQEQARQRWLNSLSDQERRSLPEEQQDLRLKYTILVSPDDLAPEGRGAGARPAGRASENAGSQAGPRTARPGQGRARRPTEADLAAQEEAYLQQLQQRAGQS